MKPNFIVLLFSASIASGQTLSPMPVPSQKALVDSYCMGCHNDRTQSGGFSWTKIDCTCLPRWKLGEIGVYQQGAGQISRVRLL